MRLPTLFLLPLLALGLSSTAIAQKGKPRAGKPTATSSADKQVIPDEGTTIVGEDESPIGLYITPWKDEYAERGLDRPARLLDEELQPIDKATFERQVEYFNTVADYRKRQLAAGAAGAAAPAK